MAFVDVVTRTCNDKLGYNTVYGKAAHADR